MNRKLRLLYTIGAFSSGIIATVYAIKQIPDYIAIKTIQKLALSSQINMDSKLVSYKRIGTRIYVELKDLRLIRKPTESLSAFDLSIEEARFTISPFFLLKKSIALTSLYIRGMRGSVDRRHILVNSLNDKNFEIAGIHYNNQFLIKDFKLEDALITLFSSSGFRPFNISILHAKLPQLRSEWIFYDVLMADSIVGLYDKCLFSLHNRQMPSYLSNNILNKWRHFKIDGLRVDHCKVSSKPDETGIFDLLDTGSVDFDLFYRLDDTIIAEDKQAIIFKLDSTLKDMHASSPNNTLSILFSPIISYINDNRPVFTISTDEFSLPINNLRNAWTYYDSNFSTLLTKAINDATVKQISKDKLKNMKKIGLWNISRLIFSLLAFTT